MAHSEDQLDVLRQSFIKAPKLRESQDHAKCFTGAFIVPFLVNIPLTQKEMHLFKWDL